MKPPKPQPEKNVETSLSMPPRVLDLLEDTAKRASRPRNVLAAEILEWGLSGLIPYLGRTPAGKRCGPGRPSKPVSRRSRPRARVG